MPGPKRLLTDEEIALNGIRKRQLEDKALFQGFAMAAISGCCGNEHSGANSPRDLAHHACAVARSMLIEYREHYPHE